MATADTAFLNPAGEAALLRPKDRRGRTGGGAGSGDEPQPPQKQKLFAEREAIYPRSIQGFWRKVKWWTLAALKRS